MNESDDSEDGGNRTNVAPLQILGAVCVGKKTLSKSDLTYVPMELNSREIVAMVDTGATHNFVSNQVVNTP